MEDAALASETGQGGGRMRPPGDFLRRIGEDGKVVIRSPNWIGDAVMSLPAIQAVRQSLPDTPISILAKPWVADLFRGNPERCQVIVYESPGNHRGLRGRWALARKLRQEKFNGGILLPNSFDSALIFFLAGIPHRAGYNTDGRRIFLTHAVPVNRRIKEGHQVGYYRHLIRSLGFDDSQARPRLGVEASQKKQAMKKAQALGLEDRKEWVGISPGAAYGSAKEWFPERYGELAERIAAQWNCQILLLGSSSERPVTGRLNPKAPIPIIDLVGRTTLGEAMALISRCRAFIGNDSGLMHVAAALGVPTVAIFGSTDPRRTGPVGETCRVIQRPIPCSPCFKARCPQNRECMERISVDEVFEEVRRIFS
jgi:heptosyltransferase-2